MLPTTELRKVDPAEVSATDIYHMISADHKGVAFNSLAPDVTIERLWNGSLIAYRSRNGLFLLEVNQGGDGTKRLNIVRMAGEDLALHFEQISRDLQHIARDLDCIAIETMVYSEKLARALRRGGAQQESVTMVLELDHG